MSLCRQKLKRLRYYRGSNSSQDWMADRLGLEICKFNVTGCDMSDCPEKRECRVWGRMSRGEEVEAMEYVCSHCLPIYFDQEMAVLNFYGTRESARFWRHEDEISRTRRGF